MAWGSKDGVLESTEENRMGKGGRWHLNAAWRFVRAPTSDREAENLISSGRGRLPMPRSGKGASDSEWHPTALVPRYSQLFVKEKDRALTLPTGLFPHQPSSYARSWEAGQGSGVFPRTAFVVPNSTAKWNRFEGKRNQRMCVSLNLMNVDTPP